MFAAGGTAGHINPAIAVANYIKKHDKQSKILFVGSKRGMEEKLVKAAGFDFVSFKVRGFQRKPTLKNILRNIDAAFLLMMSKTRAKKLIKSYNPDIVMGTGGYVSGPIVFEASKMGIKTAIHEQNAYAGFTNRTLSKYVDIVFLAVDEAKQYMSNTNCVVVGNPIRETVLLTTKKEARQKLKMDDNFCILSFGGSLGAVKLNEIAADLMEWHSKDKKINHIHSMGKLGKDIFYDMLNKRGVDYKSNGRLDIREYISDMDICMAAADLVICRSGAITVSELEAAAKASVLIPSPNVAENHQYFNARVLEKNDAAVLIEEKDYNKDKLIEIVNGFYKNADRLKSYQKNAAKLAILDTDKRIYNEITRLIAG